MSSQQGVQYTIAMKVPGRAGYAMIVTGQHLNLTQTEAGTDLSQRPTAIFSAVNVDGLRLEPWWRGLQIYLLQASFCTHHLHAVKHSNV